MPGRAVSALRGVLSDFRTARTRTDHPDVFLTEGDSPHQRNNRGLRKIAVVVFGLSATIGAGIYSIATMALDKIAGPSLFLASALGAVICSCVVACFGDLAAMMPIAGGPYVYSCALSGELLGWVVATSLVLEFSLGASVVAVTWSRYLGEALAMAGVGVATSLPVGPLRLDWGALVLVGLVTTILAAGVRTSNLVSTVITCVKVLVLVLVVVVAATYFDSRNIEVYLDSPQGLPGGSTQPSLLSSVVGAQAFGQLNLFSVVAAVPAVFFAFIGFDTVVANSEEVRDPRRTIPRSMAIAFAIVVVLYLALGLTVVGMTDYNTTALDATPLTLADVFSHRLGLGWLGVLVVVGALVGLVTVIGALMFAQTRVFIAMARHGLVGRQLSEVNTRGVHARTCRRTGALVAALTVVSSLRVLEGVVILGALVAYAVVAFLSFRLHWTSGFRPQNLVSPNPAGLWTRHPSVPVRSGGRAVSVIALAGCVVLMSGVGLVSWAIFLSVIALSLIVYRLYGFERSILGRREGGRGTGTASSIDGDGPTDDGVGPV